MTHLCRSFLLTLFPCSCLGSLPQQTVLHELLQHGSFPLTAVLHKLPQRGSLPRLVALQEQAAPARVPHRVTSPASKPAPVWASLSAGPARSLLQHELPMGSQPPSGTSTCSSVGSLPQAAGGYLLHHGPPWTAGGQPASPWSSPWAAGESLLWCLKHLLPLILHCFGVCRVASLTYSHSCVTLHFFSLLLKYVIPEALPPSLMGSALASSGSILEPAGIGSIGHGEASGSFSQKPPL